MPKHLNKTKIEWADFTWNPLTGCYQGCEFCYARRVAARFGTCFSERNFIPQLHGDRLDAPSKLKKPSIIFTCSMGELFAPWVHPRWCSLILESMYRAKNHTFVVLTKHPDMVQYELPSNVWLGTSVENTYCLQRLEDLHRTKATLKIACFEPLLDDMQHLQREVHLRDIGWVIIGGLTGPGKRFPEHEWIDRILVETRGIPVFIKDNAGWPDTVHEWPEPIFRRA